MFKSCFLTLLTLILLLCPLALLGQTEKNAKETDSSEGFNIFSDTPLTIDLEADEEEIVEQRKEKKKKRKRNVYFDLKTRRGFTKSGFGNNLKIEMFNYLREYVAPDPYVRDIYWYDFKAGRIRVSGNIDPKNAGILHGPYKVIQNDQVVEEGVFYKGTKHGRWTQYGRMYDYYILTDKRKYTRGWPRESIITWYDQERTKLKEVIPVEHGKKEGNYFHFHENGLVAVQGEYKNDEKVGKWIEFYEYRRQRKREVQYRTDPYNHDFKPYIVKEWDKTGTVIYDKEELERRLTSR
jgi:antitoxin component YwqK of YwqJK toxin-antitoxin module